MMTGVQMVTGSTTRWIVCAVLLGGCAAETGADAAVVAGTALPSGSDPLEAPLVGEPAGTPAAPASPDEASTAGTSAPAGDLWRVDEVIDGDTIRVSGPDGEVTVRLIGMNAPEEGECFHDEATAALRFALGSEGVRLTRDVSDVDRYGRWLRYVETAAGDDVGAGLVAAGYARSHHYEPDTARNATYDDLQADAQRRGAGLWAPDACGPAADSGASIAIDGQFDAPGDDHQNLGEEWVRFTNTGSDPVDLTGWRVADESSSHRYMFGTLILAPGETVTLFTGCGVDTQDARHWCNDAGAVWNNDGDTVFLTDPNGNTVASHGY